MALPSGHLLVVMCILCGLCLAVGPAGAVRVAKLYDNGALLAAG
jgi:ferredoxin